MKGLIRKFPKHEDITSAKQNLERARDYLNKMVKVVQKKCKHEEVFECEYINRYSVVRFHHVDCVVTVD